MSTAAVLLCLILAALAVFQGALIAGAPLGRFAWGGRDRVLSRRLRIGSAVSIIVYAVIGCLALARAGILASSLPDGFLVVAMWVVTVYFAFGVVLNAISRSKPERYTMTPVALVLAVLAFLVARG